MTSGEKILDYKKKGFDFLFKQIGDWKIVTVWKGSFSVSRSSSDSDETFDTLLKKVLDSINSLKEV